DFAILQNRDHRCAGNLAIKNDVLLLTRIFGVSPQVTFINLVMRAPPNVQRDSSILLIVSPDGINQYLNPPASRQRAHINKIIVPMTPGNNSVKLACVNAEWHYPESIVILRPFSFHKSPHFVTHKKKKVY